MPKTVLVTGATDGIGRLTAHTLAARGHHVLVHGRSPAKVQEVPAWFSSLETTPSASPWGTGNCTASAPRLITANTNAMLATRSMCALVRPWSRSPCTNAASTAVGSWVMRWASESPARTRSLTGAVVQSLRTASTTAWSMWRAATAAWVVVQKWHAFRWLTN